MSYGITPYRVDMDQLQALFGSQDTALKQRLLTRFADRIASLDELFDQDSGYPKTRAVIDDFFAGTVSDPGAGGQYWYVVNMLCDLCGTFLANDHWYPAACDELWELEHLRYFGLSGLPYVMDFPSVRSARSAALPMLEAEVKEKFTDNGQRRQVLSWIADAQAHNQDLMLFYY